MKKFAVVQSSAVDLESKLNDATVNGWDVFAVTGPCPSSDGSLFLITLTSHIISVRT